ncbi:acetyl-CoA carboxylase biotin carboxyl carrier protein subunit [Lentimicrobium sp.]|uniref:acetyl-CoA carboxylase biotin carboxyl carrier protein subunit n=1 Tax=Lentimicrobium sp. TaxID=2034841 RepID=UPI0025E0852D|nr:acetyl-CoA carboxylase biotin carboxyl carrier protein subunit [Lentimicrobium sp.]MCO5257029.1 acetyl-CoA carboxylase biotin carboxyl carrier protein subunit [Lentimicrobium sp.]HPF65434.1 acetyl-CoA carboxylase biotin carboxyl carrier protein subunit [Lentimicrobium sp.]HPJ61362.1 acetyl-CoA carboxylase biotin carboxyl carrier protein subunit [Lentimicrobium sp.]HPR25780.1 acetyl-CoA carboxylase biotin carboxyl carrier protein subunit [Lentimicrobium sp.]
MEGNSNQAFKTIIIDNIKYKTTLTKKFMARKMYEPVDYNKVYSFIPGTIRKIFVKEGDSVKQGTSLLELEAMKMVNNITAPVDGVVSKINVKTGDLVTKSFLLIELN